jgi:YidC/Oxa1 family membrane protein insertase
MPPKRSRRTVRCAVAFSPCGVSVVAIHGEATAGIPSPNGKPPDVFNLIASYLAWLYSLVPNYAVAIALLTLTVMVALTPLTLKGTKSMLELQKHQPEMKRIQQQYKGDRQKLNEEMMAFYKEHKINPVGGCLPLLLQAPVFIILLRVLRKLTETCTASAHAKGECPIVGNFNPSYIKHSTLLWQNLTQTNQMLSFGLDLSKSAVQKLSDGFWVGLPYLLLVAVVTALSYYQQRQIQSRASATTNPQQQAMMRIIPLVFGAISLVFPAGVVIYWLVSSVYRIVLQAYITRRFYRSDEGGDGAKPSPPPKPGRPAATKPTTTRAPAKLTPTTTKPDGKVPGKAATPPKAKPTPSRAAPGRPAPTRPTPSKPPPRRPAPTPPGEN